VRGWTTTGDRMLFGHLGGEIRGDFVSALEKALSLTEVWAPDLDMGIYFARADGKSFEVPVTHLRYTELDTVGAVGDAATSVDVVISTHRGNVGSWTAMQGQSPAGEWELALPNTEEMRNRFKKEEIEDILLVITYSGRTPAWPN
jgi:hypothetical protein